MKYYTYKIDFSDNSNEGTAPSNIQGGFEYEPYLLVGYGEDNTSITGLEKWNVTEITQEYALELAKNINKNMVVQDDGRIYENRIQDIFR